MIAILTPMRTEAEMFLRDIKDSCVLAGPDRKFTLGKLDGNEAGIFCCGVGRDHAKRWMAFIEKEYKPEIIIFAGTAGALDINLDIGDIVLATGFFLDGTSEFAECTISEIDGLGDLSDDLTYGPVLTVDRVIQKKRLRSKLFKHYNALCVEMEGFEVAKFCRERKLPLIALRVISDKADKESLANFRDNLAFVAERLHSTSLQLIKKWERR